MPDREKTLKGLEHHLSSDDCRSCVYWDGVKSGRPCEVMEDALSLLKEQDVHYRNLVVAWLREIAMNNYTDDTEMRFVDAVEEIKDRAEYGLERYFSDSRKS